MNSDYKYLESNNLGQYHDQKPIIKEPYRTVHGLLKKQVVTNQSTLDNSPDTLDQDIIGQEFINTETSPTVQSLLDIYDAEIFPIHKGLIDPVDNREPTVFEFLEQDTLLPDYQTNQQQTQHNHLSAIQNVSQNLVHLYNVPKHSVFKKHSQSHPKCDKEWKINNKIISQIRDQSASTAFTNTDPSEQVPVFTMNMNTPIDTTVSTTSSAAKNKTNILNTTSNAEKINPNILNKTRKKKTVLPNILKKTSKKHTVLKSINYERLKYLVDTLKLIEEDSGTKHDRVQSRIRKTSKVMYTLTVEIAKLSHENHLRTLSLFQGDSRLS